MALVLFLCSAGGVCEETGDSKLERIPVSPAKEGESAGLERGSWLAEGYGNPADVKVVRLPGQEQNQILRIGYRAGAQDSCCGRDP